MPPMRIYYANSPAFRWHKGCVRQVVLDSSARFVPLRTRSWADPPIKDSAHGTDSGSSGPPTLLQQLLRSELRPNRPLLSFNGAVDIQGPHRPFSLLSRECTDILFRQRISTRDIPKYPVKVLDAPQLADNFYFNVLDWSRQNLIAVALGQSIWINNVRTNAAKKLIDVGHDGVTSVRWIGSGSSLALGTGAGEIVVLDIATQKVVRRDQRHFDRVGALAALPNILSSGGRDRQIIHTDLRSSQAVAQSTFHQHEICGMRWNKEETMLASGGNDNLVCVWQLNSARPILHFDQHSAAVKALDWCPHRRGLLATGGGCVDRSIRVWNVIQNTQLSVLDTGSQVCNLHWSESLNEIISTHGFSQYEISVWKCPSMQKITSLLGHSLRVLHLAASPDGHMIVTGSGDETLRFWKLSEKKTQHLSQMAVNALR